MKFLENSNEDLNEEEKSYIVDDGQSGWFKEIKSKAGITIYSQNKQKENQRLTTEPIEAETFQKKSLKCCLQEKSKGAFLHNKLILVPHFTD